MNIDDWFDIAVMTPYDSEIRVHYRQIALNRWRNKLRWINCQHQRTKFKSHDINHQRQFDGMANGRHFVRQIT